MACDAQTSGGLLLAVPESEAEPLVASLRGAGVRHATIIGRVEASDRPTIELVD
jgi:selenide,water dikinase